MNCFNSWKKTIDLIGYSTSLCDQLKAAKKLTTFIVVKNMACCRYSIHFQIIIIAFYFRRLAMFWFLMGDGHGFSSGFPLLWSFADKFLDDFLLSASIHLKSSCFQFSVNQKQGNKIRDWIDFHIKLVIFTLNFILKGNFTVHRIIE